MAQVTGIKGDAMSTHQRPQTRGVGRPSKGKREEFMTRITQPQFDQVTGLVEELEMSRSDFGTYALITMANQIRAMKGQPPIEMPPDITRAVSAGIALYLNPQEALVS